MEKFKALLKKIHSFIQKNGGSLVLRIKRCETMDEEISVSVHYLDPNPFKRGKIKRWFKKTLKATKGSFAEEFNCSPSLEFSYLNQPNGILNFVAEIHFHRPLFELVVQTKGIEHIINQEIHWDFKPRDPYWGWRERDEGAQA